MAENKKNWKQTKDGEFFLQGTHLQSQEWNLNMLNGKDYISDSLVYHKIKNLSLPMKNFEINSLIHVTTPPFAANILRDGGFKPNMKDLSAAENYPKSMNNFIWWGIAIEREDFEDYEKQCKDFTESMLLKKFKGRFTHGRKDELYKNFCNSPPFCRESRYGNVMFRYNINELLKAYSSQYCNDEAPSLHVMGTFAYCREVNHVILVRPPQLQEDTLPPVSEVTSVMFKEDFRWKWKPEATSDVRNEPASSSVVWGSRRWEHVTFAFHIPESSGNEILKLENLEMHITYCPPKSPFRRHTTVQRDKFDLDKAIQDLRSQEKMSTTHLLSIIHKHLIQNWQLQCDAKMCQGGCINCTKYVQLKLATIESLLGGTAESQSTSICCAHQLLEKVKDPKECTKRWKLWVHEMAHYLLHKPKIPLTKTTKRPDDSDPEEGKNNPDIELEGVSKEGRDLTVSGLPRKSTSPFPVGNPTQAKLSEANTGNGTETESQGKEKGEKLIPLNVEVNIRKGKIVQNVMSLMEDDGKLHSGFAEPRQLPEIKLADYIPKGVKITADTIRIKRANSSDGGSVEINFAYAQNA